MTAYLDHNATTPVRPEVVDAMIPWLREGYGNPSSVYALGQKSRAAVERAREQVAAILGANDASEIIFTSCGSEADVLAIAGGAWQVFDESKGRRRRIVTSRMEHDAIRVLSSQLKRRGLDVLEVANDVEGVLDLDAWVAAMADDVSVASVMHANNETGVFQPISKAAAAAKAKGILFHTDAVQSLGKVAIDAKSLGADLIAVSGHKVNAPKGIGALWARRGVRLSMIVTGHQEKNRRGGTENVAAIVGFGLACELARKELASAADHALALRKKIEAGVLKIPGVRLNGRGAARLPNTAHFSFEGFDGHNLVVALDLEGICVSSGPACSSGASMPSHVLTAMGLPANLATGSMRVSVGWGSTDADVDRLLAVLPKAVEKLRAAVPA